MNYLARVERGFSAWGHFVFRHRWLVLLSTLAATGYLVSWVPLLTVDNSTESFLMPDDPARMDYDAMRAQFGQDEEALVIIRTPAVFDLAFRSAIWAMPALSGFYCIRRAEFDGSGTCAVRRQLGS